MDDLERAMRAYRRAETALHDRKAELVRAMVDAIDSGVPQKEVCRVTGWTREYVRRMLIDARKASQD